MSICHNTAQPSINCTVCRLCWTVTVHGATCYGYCLLCKAKPRVCVDRDVFRSNMLLPLSGYGVRQTTVTSTDQHCANLVQLFVRQNSDGIKCIMENFYQSARGQNCTDLRISYSPVSQHTAVLCMCNTVIVMAAFLCTIRLNVNSVHLHQLFSARLVSNFHSS
jgi:hypothetical protein